MSAPRAEPQQARSRETRQRLLDAATDLIRERGFEATRASDVSERAGVAEGTFFFHFPRKADLLVELGLRTADQIAADVPLAAGPVAEELETVVAHLCARLRRMPRELVRETVLELYRHADQWSELRKGRRDFQTTFRELYLAGIGRGEVSDRLDVDDTARMLSASVLHAILLWAQDVIADADLDAVLRRRVRVIHQGAVALAGPGEG